MEGSGQWHVVMKRKSDAGLGEGLADIVSEDGAMDA
jgi:hypothetical protein